MPGIGDMGDKRGREANQRHWMSMRSQTAGRDPDASTSHLFGEAKTESLHLFNQDTNSREKAAV